MHTTRVEAPARPAARPVGDLSPDLVEVLHMLEAIEEDAAAPDAAAAD
jgi:hypothetical protein